MLVTIHENGKQIGTVHPQYVKREVENDYIRSGYGTPVLTYTKSATTYVNSNNIDFTDGYMVNVSNPPVYEFKYSRLEIPVGTKIPKRKRIRKKFNKKHTVTLAMKNCVIRFN